MNSKKGHKGNEHFQLNKTILFFMCEYILILFNFRMNFPFHFIELTKLDNRNRFPFYFFSFFPCSVSAKNTCLQYSMFFYLFSNRIHKNTTAQFMIDVDIYMPETKIYKILI